MFYKKIIEERGIPFKLKLKDKEKIAIKDKLGIEENKDIEELGTED